jgi:DNA-directed RNA polymerase subunit RPC12/RpoP
MPIDVKCPQCGAELEAPDEAVGKKVKCPDCGDRIPVAAAPENAIQETASPRPAAPPEGEEVRESRPRRRERDEEEEDDRPRRRRRRDEDEEPADDGVSTIIPYKNGRALAAYYCGVFAVIPCLGLILGPLALGFGIAGVRFANRHPTARGAVHAWVGIILGALTALANWGVLTAGLVTGAIASLNH